MTDVALLTVETIPVERYLGGVSGWAQSQDLAKAESDALRHLRAAAVAIGANAVIGWRVAVAATSDVTSESRRFSEQVLIASEQTHTVFAYGTGVVLRAT